jgi:ribosome-associated protein
MKRETGEAIAIECARIAESHRADRVVVLDVGRDVVITDYFVICSASSVRRCKGIAEEIKLQMKERGVDRLGIEGRGEGRWTLLDYHDVIVHVFLEEARQFYELEILWESSPKVDWEGGDLAARPAAVEPSR